MSTGVQQRKKSDISSQMEQGMSPEKKAAPKKNLAGRPPRRRRRMAGKPVAREWVLGFGLMTLGVLIAGYFLMSRHEKAQIENIRENIIHEKVEPMSREWEEKLANLLEENEELKKEVAESSQFKANKTQLEEQIHEVEDIRDKQEKDIQHLIDYKRQMQRNIELLSKTELLEKFGPGPHHVEVNLAFDPEFPKGNESDGDTGRIVIEMAPVEEMPHTVYWFLEQVNRTLYDGCSFHRNAGHVIQGGPVPNFLSPPEPKLNRRFVDAGFHSVLFQEYSPNFPHKKYTLGFAGRPGGPDFYISTMDNSLLHGPGGQTNYEDSSEADPCFAKVVDGFDVVDRMLLSPVKPGNYRAMETNVAITSMEIVSYESKKEDKEAKAEKLKNNEFKEEKVKEEVFKSSKDEELKLKEEVIKSSKDEEISKEEKEKVKDTVESKSKDKKIQESSSASKSKKEVIDTDSESRLEKKLAADAKQRREVPEAVERKLEKDIPELDEMLQIRAKKKKGAKKRHTGQH